MDSFNPLAGIRCIQTRRGDRGSRCVDQGFNPLAGIRCIQTLMVCVQLVVVRAFVSIPWRGFVVFRQEVRPWARHRTTRFNPLAGIRCIQTYILLKQDVYAFESFNPLAGIRCIQTCFDGDACRYPLLSFNPLAGIRCIQTTIP